jgi:ribosomal-protein-alanine N-acetyltransferase
LRAAIPAGHTVRVKSPTIHTPRYEIRSFRRGDVALWHVWDVDPEVQAHMPEPPNERQTDEAELAYLEACEEDGAGYYWSVEVKGGPTIGTVSLSEIDSHHSVAHLGVLIGDKSYWGKGAATEVVRAVTRYALWSLGIGYIAAEVETENLPMRRVLEKAGFAQDGLFRGARVKNGRRIDVTHFGIGAMETLGA